MSTNYLLLPGSCTQENRDNVRSRWFLLCCPLSFSPCYSSHVGLSHCAFILCRINAVLFSQICIDFLSNTVFPALSDLGVSVMEHIVIYMRTLFLGFYFSGSCLCVYFYASTNYFDFDGFMVNFKINISCVCMKLSKKTI